jgi:hypothetical protein
MLPALMSPCDTFCMRIPQCIRDQAKRSQRIVDACAGKYGHVGTIDCLQAEIGAIGIVMKLEHSHDVRMHQATANAPLSVEPIAGRRICRLFACQKFEGDDTLRLPVTRQPYLGHPSMTETTEQSIAVTQPCAFTQYPHTLTGR